MKKSVNNSENTQDINGTAAAEPAAEPVGEPAAGTAGCCAADDAESTGSSVLKELEAVKCELDGKNKQCEEYFNMLQRKAAEFDNYKKRTVKEKEGLFSDAACDVICTFLPVIDSVDRALQVMDKEGAAPALREGVELIAKQARDILKSLGVEEIKGVGESFDPQYHEAVMHIEDETYGRNVIVEEFRKGYVLKDRVVRHSMVKVAN